MASASSSSPFFGVREDEHHTQVMQQQSSSAPPPQAAAPVKKRRSLPGNPYPDAEVIALSPRTLLATNRFICEVCNKGFQREQNLQLHRRGHNLPWKLRQKTTKEVRRRVYLCPEPTCVHHEPSRALGDLTGVKKHFCRKHGEKKWKCDKCSKRYAVQSDLKAHSKICGTREYRCDCGTLFSRRDSFITHRAFCDALVQEGARLPTALNTLGGHLYGNSNMVLGSAQVSPQITSLHDQSRPSTDLLHLGRVGSSQFEHLIAPSKPLSFGAPQPPPYSSPFYLGGGGGSDKGINGDTPSHHSLLQSKNFHGLMQLPDLQGNTTGSSSSSAAAAAGLFNLGFFSNDSNTCSNAMNKNVQPMPGDQIYDSNRSTEQSTLFAGNLVDEHMAGGIASRYSTLIKNEPVMLPQQLSATALLQKAAQIGATSSGGSSLLGGFGSSASPGKTANYSASFSGSHSSVGDGFRSPMENETQIQHLMNSLASGGMNGLFGSSTGMAAFEGSCTTAGGRHGQENTGFGRFNGNMRNMNEGKYNLSSTGNLGGSDGLTRDFLGVGSMVRSMGPGISQREQHHGINMSPLDPDMRSGSSSRYFAGGSLQ
ncbi:protein indeterminate-domain 4, chloroplastic isoform X1 [Musa acuminata AAA Group]|uniref:protein indeterminate-domain 4, chloroplastic isoform X1 n=1 Tax=Musa acuminata AAA Group TaxID=214697 RepID=UPI0031E2849F